MALISEPWPVDGAGVLVLPSGRRVRGRALRDLPEGLAPTFGLYLAGRQPPSGAWESRWLRWPDFRLPVDEVAAVNAIRAAWERLDVDRVEVACAGGRGRTGTVLACLVVLDAAPDGATVDAVAHVRAHYDPRAVETLWQRRYVARFPRGRRSAAASLRRWPRTPLARGDCGSAPSRRSSSPQRESTSRPTRWSARS